MWSIDKNIRFYGFILLILFFWVDKAYFFEHYMAFSLILFVTLLVDFIYKLGNSVHVLDLMGINGVLAYLLAPSLAYYLTDTDWYEGVNFMAVTKNDYLSVAIPGTLALLAGLCFPFKSTQVNHKVYYEKVSKYLRDKSEVGVHLFWTGLISGMLMYVAPSSAMFLLTVMSYFIYIGGLYIWFSDHDQRLFYLIGMFAVPLIKAARSGMFGELIFWSIFVVLLLMIKYNTKFYIKIVCAVVGLVMMLFIQSMKFEFRLNTWYEQGEVSLSDRMDLMKGMAGDRIDNPVLLFGKATLTGALERTNQGYLTAMAIRYTPQYEPFAEGETIFTAILASFVPRALWPDKPTVGGRENMLRFTGFDIGETTSMDIGQLGDSYVNFGKWGGAACMFFYGLLFQFVFAMLLQISGHHRPSMLLWIPLFFAVNIHLESSILACVNHLVKTAMLTYIFVLGYRYITGKEL